MLNKESTDLRWRRKRASYIFGGAPLGYTGEETGILLRLEQLQHLELGENVLDLGCAAGAHLQPLKKRGLQTFGLDPNRSFLLKGKGRDNAHSFVQAIGENIPVRDEVFDLILVFEVLEHAMEPDKVLQEANRILKPNGLLFLTAPNKFYPFETHGIQLFQKQINNPLRIGIPFFSFAPNFLRKRFERARVYSTSKLVSILRKNGFEPFKIDFMMPPLDKVRRTSLRIAMRRILHSLSRLPLVKKFGISVMVLSRKGQTCQTFLA